VSTTNFELHSSDFELKHADIATDDRERDAERRDCADVRTVRVGLLGYGRIGQAVAALAGQEAARLGAAGLDLRCVGALVRDLAKPRMGPAVPLSTRSTDVVHDDVDVVVEVLGGIEPARTLVAAALRAGRPVVSANKTLVATCGQELKALADANGTVFACDAAVLAGVPFIGSLSRRPLISAARRIEGIVNGTCHFIVDAVARGTSFNAAVKEAVERGYAEPDTAADTSGRDAAEKLTILLHLAGCHDVKVADLTCTSLGVLEPDDLRGAGRLGGTIKPVAIASLDPAAPGAWVGPAFVAGSHAFARLEGVANALCLTGRNGHAVTFSGPGAGPEATAVTIIDDVVEAVTGARSRRAAPRPAESAVAVATLRQPPRGPWFLVLGDDERPEWPAEAIEVLSSRGVRVDRQAVEQGRLVALTAPTSWQAIQDIVWAFHARGTRTLVLPALGIGS
jgi:homoserine dehydrogenase